MTRKFQTKKSRVLLLLLFFSPTCDQSEFNKNTVSYLNLGDADYISNAHSTLDGGFLLAGSTTSVRNNEDMLVIKLDADLNLQWGKTFGAERADEAFDAIETRDHQFLVTGRIRSDDGDYDLYVAKLNAYGEMVWSRIFGGTGYDEGRRLHDLGDDRYMVIGRTDGFGAQNSDIWLLTLDNDGDSLSSKSVGWPFDEIPLGSIRTDDGDLLITGYSGSFGSFYRAMLVKIDLEGNIVWYQSYGGCNRMEGVSIVEVPGGGYVVAGRNGVRCHPYVNYDACFIRTGPTGDSLWTRNFGVTTYDELHSIVRLDDGSYLGVGQSYHISPKFVDDFQTYVIHLDANGDSLWTRSYGGPQADGAVAICSDAKGGFLIIGYTQNPHPGQTAILFIRTNNQGEF